jgi:hypothetical protein
MRSKIEMSWNSVYTPADVPLQVLVNDGSGSDVNAATGSPLPVRPTYWKVHMETRQGQKARKLKKAPNELSREEDQCRQLLD